MRGRIFGGVTDTTLVVDCKCWKSRIDIKGVDSFISMIEDVGADIGLIVTTIGATDGASERARQARAVQLKVLSLDELRQWRPPGTVELVYRLPADRSYDAQSALRNLGFRVAPERGFPASADEVVFGVFRHYGTRQPSPELQSKQRDRCVASLRKLGIEPIHVATSITGSGGTPGHRWLEVAVRGAPIGLKVLAATEAEAEQQLDRVLDLLGPGVARESLSVVKPVGWPTEGLFGS